jgi:hypothetical protein
MKKVLYIITAIMLVGMTGCKEDFVGQPPTDKQAPAPVKNPVAESIPGGAKITYELPNDADLLCVKAIYAINGVERNTSASLSSNVLEIRGFGTTESQTVSLYSIDRSGNMSTPVLVPITPGIPPILPIIESVQMREAFGGIQLTWRNESKADVAIYVLGMGKDGEMEEIDIIFSNSIDGKYNVRGQEAVERQFGVYVRDRWDNISEIKTATLTPIYEETLDKTLLLRKTLPGDNETSSGFGGWYHINNDIWQTDDIWETETGKSPILFTIDLGFTAKLSRYALWHRGHNDWEYIHHNPKYWTVWGTSTIKEGQSDKYWTAEAEGEGWKADWVKLADCVSFKPSGMDTPVTQEDRDYAHLGFQFDMPLEAPPMRYIRFHVTETWGGGNMLHISELTFWGTVIN